MLLYHHLESLQLGYKCLCVRSKCCIDRVHTSAFEGGEMRTSLHSHIHLTAVKARLQNFIILHWSNFTSKIFKNAQFKNKKEEEENKLVPD